MQFEYIGRGGILPTHEKRNLGTQITRMRRFSSAGRATGECFALLYAHVYEPAPVRRP
jgi:hypothetical protein